MKDKIINGKTIANQILNELKEKTEKLKVKPGLALILVGENPASEVYVKMKGRACEQLGYYSVTDRLPESTSQDELVNKIISYNNNENIHGILIQLPLPKHINELKILESVDPRKDIDGFHPVNAGRLLIGEKSFVPCTPAGIIELLNRYKVQTSGKNAVVLGRSNIVGKPISILLSQKSEMGNATVTICHSLTPDIKSLTSKADIIVAAIGKPDFLTPDMIKDGVVIIDVGINRIKNSESKTGYSIVGDVDFEGCKEKASLITPVPGGVGPMTIAMLMRNTYDAAANNIYG